jgi:hypothetical protein
VYKEGVGLFVWAKLPEGVKQRRLLIESCMRNQFYYAGTILVMEKDTFWFALCVKEEN